MGPPNGGHSSEDIMKRRTVLGAGCAVSLASCAGRRKAPLNFVLVHGA